MQRFLTLMMLTAGLVLMVTMARGQEACQSCETPGKCTWVTATKKVKTPCYSCKSSEYCPSTISANSPCWAAVCEFFWGSSYSAPRTKHQLVKRYTEKEVPYQKLQVVAPNHEP